MSPVNTNNTTIVNNVKPGSKVGKTRIPGALNINRVIQSECEEILRKYDKEEKYQARKETKQLLEKYPESLVVKKLDVLILCRDKKYKRAYEKIQALLKNAPKDVRMINMQGII